MSVRRKMEGGRWKMKAGVDPATTIQGYISGDDFVSRQNLQIIQSLTVVGIEDRQQMKRPFAPNATIG